jgi:hypothetical protein
MMKDPQAYEALLKKREMQKAENIGAMKDYYAAELATRNKTAKLRELRLAKEALDRQVAASAPPKKKLAQKAKAPAGEIA